MQNAVDELQNLLGCSLKPAWLTQHRGASAQALLAKYLWTDIALTSNGCLPVDCQVSCLVPGATAALCLSRAAPHPHSGILTAQHAGSELVTQASYTSYARAPGQAMGALVPMLVCRGGRD
jgi:hypothetical protein